MRYPNLVASSFLLLLSAQIWTAGLQAKVLYPTTATRDDTFDSRKSHTFDDSSARFPVSHNPQVITWTKRYQGPNRQSVATWRRRSAGLADEIRAILNRNRVPSELLYLTYIESGFRPRAVSKRRAAGIWQLRKTTARIYGLVTNDLVDERFDPIKSTHAAAAYLKSLYQRFGNWELAIAAYNAGPTRIAKALRQSPVDTFWALSSCRLISKQTRSYVPKFSALVLHNRSLNKTEPKSFFPSHVLKITHRTTLEDASKKLRIDPQQLAKWNPELLKKVIPGSRNKPYALRVNAGCHARAKVLTKSL